jgi:hypothetical protein
MACDPKSIAEPVLAELSERAAGDGRRIAMTKSVRDTTSTNKDGAESRASGAEQQRDVAPRDAATQSFICGVVERGEAGYCDAHGKLPLPYKYAILGIHPDGLPILKRVRT